MATESSLDQMMRQPGSGGEVDAELKGHTNLVMSVAFSRMAAESSLDHVMRQSGSGM